MIADIGKWLLTDYFFKYGPVVGYFFLENGLSCKLILLSWMFSTSKFKTSAYHISKFLVHFFHIEIGLLRSYFFFLNVWFLVYLFVFLFKFDSLLIPPFLVIASLDLILLVVADLRDHSNSGAVRTVIDFDLFVYS